MLTLEFCDFQGYVEGIIAPGFKVPMKSRIKKEEEIY